MGSFILITFGDPRSPVKPSKTSVTLFAAVDKGDEGFLDISLPFPLKLTLSVIVISFKVVLTDLNSSSLSS